MKDTCDVIFSQPFISLGLTEDLTISIAWSEYRVISKNFYILIW